MTTLVSASCTIRYTARSTPSGSGPPRTSSRTDGTEDHGERVDRLSEDLARDDVVRLQRFSDWCAGEQTCALHGQDVRQVMMSTFTDWNSKLAADARLLVAGHKGFPRLATDIAKAAGRRHVG